MINRSEGSRSRGASANVHRLSELNEDAPHSCRSTSSSLASTTTAVPSAIAAASPRACGLALTSPRTVNTPLSPSVESLAAANQHRRLLRLYMVCLLCFGIISVGMMRSNLAFGVDQESTAIETGTGLKRPIFRSQPTSKTPRQTKAAKPSSPPPLDLAVEAQIAVAEQGADADQEGDEQEETDRELPNVGAEVLVGDDSQDSSEVQYDADLIEMSELPVEASVQTSVPSTPSPAPTPTPTPARTLSIASQTSAPTQTPTISQVEMPPTPTPSASAQAHSTNESTSTPSPSETAPTPISSPSQGASAPTPSQSAPTPTPPTSQSTPTRAPTPPQAPTSSSNPTESVVISLSATAVPASSRPQSRSSISKCFRERDFGLLDELRDKVRRYCMDQSTPLTSTSISSFDVGAGLKATAFRNLSLDLTRVQIASPIKSIAEDGAHHDPRFVFNKDLVHCSCHEVLTGPASSAQPVDLWDRAFTKLDARTELSALCLPEVNHSTTPMPLPQDGNPKDVVVKEKVIVLARKDDHNPFFQISAALNAWILVQALNWDLAQTRLVQLDAGYDTPTDELQKQVLSPNYEVLKGAELRGKRVFFENDVLLAPYEVSGPMMQHLNDYEPCRDSQLLKAFRQLVLAKFHVAEAKSQADRCVVTIITRKNYDGRAISRRWLNEDQVVVQMREKYATQPSNPRGCEFQSIDFVALAMAKQVEIIKDSDLVIGMHGAGMVNVLWTRPGTPVIEIFPRKRKRWGYRNLCQFIGCDWHEFRGGQDTGEGDNKSDKTIPFDEWIVFFDPVFQSIQRPKER